MQINPILIQMQNVLIQYDVKVPQSELLEFLALFESKQYAKNEVIQKEGSLTPTFGYITKGLIRFYYNNNDKEYNQSFKCEHRVFMNYYTAFAGLPSLINIQALEESEVLVADYDKITNFFNKSGQWQKLGRMILERNFLSKAKRERDLIINDPYTMLMNFNDEYKHLEGRISKHHLSLYLGINPASLSRLLKRHEGQES